MRLQTSPAQTTRRIAVYAAMIAIGAVVLATIAEGASAERSTSAPSARAGGPPSFRDCAKDAARVDLKRYRFRDAAVTVVGGSSYQAQIKFILTLPSMGSCSGERHVAVHLTNNGKKFTSRARYLGNNARREDLEADFSGGMCPVEADFDVVVKSTYKQLGIKPAKSKRVFDKKESDDVGC